LFLEEKEGGSSSLNFLKSLISHFLFLRLCKILNTPMKSILKLSFLVLFSLTLNSCGYNGMITGREAVTAQWSNVENEYQRRANLVDNIVETVKAAGKYEQETLEKVIKARAEATSVKIDPTNLSQEDIDKYQSSQSTLSRLLGNGRTIP
jgi:LemA protein